jgi:hypothetical protein
MVAIQQPIPGISFTPPSTREIIHPTAWVYQICPRRIGAELSSRAIR